MSNPNESVEFGESPSSGGASANSSLLTLTKAIEYGEYDPHYLSTFEEWHKLPKHTQFELITQAMRNRTRQLHKRWAEINNVLDFSKKPQMKSALKNIQDQIRQIDVDKEKLFLEYSRE